MTDAIAKSPSSIECRPAATASPAEFLSSAVAAPLQECVDSCTRRRFESAGSAPCRVARKQRSPPTIAPTPASCAWTWPLRALLPPAARKAQKPCCRRRAPIRRLHTQASQSICVTHQASCSPILRRFARKEKRPLQEKVKKSSRGSAAAIQTLPASASACISSPPAPVAPLSFCAGKPTTVHRPRAGCAAANLPSRASSPALLSYRPAPSTAAPNPRNRASQANPAATRCFARTPQSPPAAQPFPDSGLHLSLPKPQPEPRFSPDTPSTPRAGTAPSLRVHSSARCPPLPPALLPRLAVPHPCNTPGSSTVFPLPAANAHNFQTRDRSPSAPLPAARRPSATSP